VARNDMPLHCWTEGRRIVCSPCSSISDRSVQNFRKAFAATAKQIEAIRRQWPGYRGDLPAPLSEEARTLRAVQACRLTRYAQSSFARPRSFLEEDRRDFTVSRRILEPSVGRLGRRVFGATCARAISSFSRAWASARLASCVRCTRDVMINTPSRVARLPANARRRRRTSAGSERDWPTSKRSWTAVETLLTFWPPEPEARTKVIMSSESGMNMRKCYFQNSP